MKIINKIEISINDFEEICSHLRFALENNTIFIKEGHIRWALRVLQTEDETQKDE